MLILIEKYSTLETWLSLSTPTQQPPNPSNKLVVMVVCGAGCGWATHTHAQVQQDIGKPRHIGDRQKALDKTSQTIAFN
jgi:hypothetical protein